MNSAFNNLPEEKRNRIIQICIEEFAEHGYMNASTNTITSRAEISKGILFHYFKNKKSLYLYMLEYSIDILAEKVFSVFHSLQNRQMDFFESIKISVLKKMELATLYPNENKLIMMATYQLPVSIKEDVLQLIMKKREVLEPMSTEYIYHSLREDMLVDGLSREKAIEMINALFEFLGVKYGKIYKGEPEELIKNQHLLMEDLNIYTKVLKYGLYSPSKNSEKE
ncbi:TetR/AcrR family transcriptional regulator [Bacillus spongiae]|uniref:TetR/AcrR family transcriptional regulator n=1 Tax=Bacillus spongiae TaxID=2683610 RepID=A0ABU8HF90_9BACI